MNVAELLRLYLDFDLLDEAARLTLSYINSVVGSDGCEHINLKVVVMSRQVALRFVSRYEADEFWLEKL